MRKAKKVLGWSVIAFLAVFIAVLLASVVPGSPYSFKIVRSDSMKPAFEAGSVVVVWSKSDYSLGDIIVYNFKGEEGELVAHRIVDRKEEGFLTQGDASSVVDENLVKQEDVLGEVVYSIPGAGKAVNFAKTPLGFGIIVIAVAAVFVYDECRKFFCRNKKKKTQEELEGDGDKK
ncbi:MAG: signal peptidase I [Candidatus Moranbacteria bacterium]|nr:signal peptidase I [Candidatus Moranbacteria bacterium]